MPDFLYHVTTLDHYRMIQETGLQARTRTPKSGKRLYAVEIGVIGWAIDHVMSRHGIGYRQAIVIEISTNARHDWKRYNRAIWYTCQPVIESDLCTVWDEYMTFLGYINS